jgi:hypothetical protein
MKAYFDALGVEASLNIRISGTEHIIPFSDLASA